MRELAAPKRMVKMRGEGERNLNLTQLMHVLRLCYVVVLTPLLQQLTTVM
jgi:uncharacterized membrane protein AbrB (regulator of aidB expression)